MPQGDKCAGQYHDNFNLAKSQCQWRHGECIPAIVLFLILPSFPSDVRAGRDKRFVSFTITSCSLIKARSPVDLPQYIVHMPVPTRPRDNMRCLQTLFVFHLEGQDISKVWSELPDIGEPAIALANHFDELCFSRSGHLEHRNVYRQWQACMYHQSSELVRSFLVVLRY